MDKEVSVVDLSLSRRKFLVLTSSFVAMTATKTMGGAILYPSRPQFSARKLSLFNIHTQEAFEGIYWREGHYEERALARLAYLLRDRRNQKQHPMDPHLFDVLHRLHVTLGTQEGYQIICGYRSEETNAKLHKQNAGVAKKSLHVQGKAIDLRVDHLPLKDVRNAARSLKAGGVGYYPQSNFVHVDIRPKPAFWGQSTT
jgi:uncharacterized protein YcbK (DUF882 family)